jgi:predicted AlkP superfamily pyrophosphatase or phosphodiesterase
MYYQGFANVSTEKINQGPPASYLIILSIDGLNPQLYLSNKWPAPTIQQMALEGTHAHWVRGIFSSVTFPSHIALVIGALPAEHGILRNSTFSPGDEDGYYSNTNKLQVNTIWDVVKENGGVSAGFNWSASVGGNIYYNIVEFWSTDSSDELYLSYTTAKPEEVADELGRKVFGEIGLIRFRHHENAGPIDFYMIEEIKPNLLLFRISNTDAAQHRHGRERLEVNRSVVFADVHVHRMSGLMIGQAC